MKINQLKRVHDLNEAEEGQLRWKIMRWMVLFNLVYNPKRIHDLNEAEEGQLGWKIMRWVVLFNLVNNPMMYNQFKSLLFIHSIH
jgi:hypothetical protein